MCFLYKRVKFENEIIAIREYKANSKSLVLFVHGAGSSNQKLFEPICKYLQAKHKHCLSFDFSGHGDSSNYAISSISKKTRQLKGVLDL